MGGQIRSGSAVTLTIVEKMPRVAAECRRSCTRKENERTDENQPNYKNLSVPQIFFTQVDFHRALHQQTRKSADKM